MLVVKPNLGTDEVGLVRQIKPVMITRKCKCFVWFKVRNNSLKFLQLKENNQFYDEICIASKLLK